MADNDVWLKACGSWWYKGYKGAIGDCNPEEVASLLPQGASELLRSCGGVADFSEVEELLRPFFGPQRDLFGNDAEAAELACEQLARQRAGQGVHSQLAEWLHRAARGILLEVQMEGPLAGDAGGELARRFVWEATCAGMVDRLNCAFKFNQRFWTENGGDAIAAARAGADFCDGVREALPQHLESLARAVARENGGAELPLCRQRMPKRSQAEFEAMDVSA